MERCERCDRETCRVGKDTTHRQWNDGYGKLCERDCPPCIAQEQCDRNRVNWRLRCLAAESRPRLSPEERATVERLRDMMSRGAFMCDVASVLAIFDRLAPREG